MDSYQLGDVAVCILAAGGSRRMGRCKQTLDWKGKPLIRHIVETGIDSGVGAMMVVTGAYRKEVEKALNGMRIAIIYNEQWQKGQGTSIKCALANLPSGIKACIFMMADQPFVTKNHLRELTLAACNSEADIFVSNFRSKRFSPVLFKSTTFRLLSKLDDNQTGRDVFTSYTIQEVEAEDERISVDIDSEEDYLRWKDE